MKRPNFFIVGAPKCGTTALSTYLSEHPNIFFCEPKEPHFFAEDFDGHRPIRNIDAYLGLFKEAGDKHLAVGEGSVFYLYSQSALTNIRQFDPAARIIVMLRNPVDLVASLHQHYLHSLYEDKPDLGEAWGLQETRKKGAAIPRLCRQPELLMYGEVGAFAAQIERLFAIFPRQQIRIILFDDFVSATALAYRETLAFLGVPDDGRETFQVVNEARALRPRLASISRRVPKGVRNALTSMRFNRYLRRIPEMADALLKVSHSRRPLDDKTYNEIAGYFKDDVARLSVLTGRDLSGWCQPRRSR